MSKARKMRLVAVSRQIDAMPLAPEVVSMAFDKFRETGELPEVQRLAAEVVKRAESGDVDGRYGFNASWAESIRILRDAVDNPDALKPQPEPLRKQLFREAVYGEGVVRMAGREAIRFLVAAGQDVTDRDFIDPSVEMPEFGSVGLYLLGFPERFVKPPFEEQAQRLFERFAVLRDRLKGFDDS